MKKIRVITFHRAHNYGAMLQAYALINVLNKKNEAKIIDYRDSNIEKHYKIFKFYGRNLVNILKQLISNVIYYKKNKKRYTSFNEFMKNNLNCTNKSYYKIKKFDENADIYITGSDQIWNKKITGELSDAYTLNFGRKDVKRISYAASVGDSKKIIEYAKEFQKKLSSINYISVREEDAQKELLKIIEKPISVVLDPTLLLTKNEWDSKITNCKKINAKYILAYVVEENAEYRKIVNYLSEKTGLKVIHFEKRNKYNDVLKSAYTEGPLEFVNLIKNAEYVITTSFHATVFSILFKKNFFIVPHSGTEERVINLLEKLKIEERVYYNVETFKNVDYDIIKTDWTEVEERLKIERKKSYDWLKKAIEGELAGE